MPLPSSRSGSRRKTTSRKTIMKAVILGIITLSLYILLFAYESFVLSISAQGGWHFIAPIVIAFLFSFVHGAFTSTFWDAVGIHAKK